MNPRVLKLTQEENLCRQRKYLTGNATLTVEGLFISANAADRIMDILKQLFGGNDLIVKQLVYEVEQLPIVRSNDFNTFTHFSENITNLVTTFELMEMTYYLECPQLLDKLLHKLPYSMQLS